ncbi:hypothetical protein KUCAC02_016708 [Chaenocephalus aceratus]|nr:hypothetical protein KUCAC02_016708 [Chaenocephalus aceratus]
MFMYASRHQVKFLVRVNRPGDKPESDISRYREVNM